ncbi:MAG TPA: MEDS domain-containing protein [Verrucomicrobiae bacterium]
MHDPVITPLAAATARLRRHDHLCLIYETAEEQFSAIVPYIKAGLERHEKCLYIADDNTATMVLDALRRGGIAVEAALKSGGLAVLTKQDTYLKDGRFDPDRMIELLEEATDRALREGYSALRVTGEMTWNLGGDPGAERLMEYEAKLNYFLPMHNALALCQYNRRRFRPEVLMDVLYTHPLAICGGMVCRNFYYLPPDEYLKPELVARRLDWLLRNIVDREQAELKLQERSAQLEEKNAELETMLKGFAGQEIRMSELKEKLRKLEQRGPHKPS